MLRPGSGHSGPISHDRVDLKKWMWYEKKGLAIPTDMTPRFKFQSSYTSCDVGSDLTSCLRFCLHEMELTATSQVIVGIEQDTNIWEGTQHDACHMMESQKAQVEMTLDEANRGMLS